MRLLLISMLFLATLALACGGGEHHPTGVESTEILAREQATEQAEVLHVLIGWDALAPNYGGRMAEQAKTRPRATADALALDVLQRARADEDFLELMKELSEDWASAASGKSYPVTPDASLVPPFKALSLRLEPGEVGVVETAYGWHVIKRIE